jgi:hypothetical protein
MSWFGLESGGEAPPLWYLLFFRSGLECGCAKKLGKGGKM